MTPASNLTSDAVPSSCSSTITPACLQALYGIPTTSNAVKTNVLGVSGFIEQFANQADLKVRITLILENLGQYLHTFLQTFLGRLRTDIPSTTTFSLETVDGGQNPQSSSEAGVEAVS